MSSQGTARLGLIAKDEEPTATAPARVVEEAGYACMLAARGHQALELPRVLHPALLVTDLMCRA
jgi:DNA-binding response OmpR family regulator